MLLPAIKPDLALFHAAMADAQGNVSIGRQRDLMTLAHASVKTIVTVERLRDGNLLDDPTFGGWDPTRILRRGGRGSATRRLAAGLPEYYAADVTHLAEYAQLAASAEGFANISTSM